MSTLDTEIKDARQDIYTDGYDMSIGELMNLYKNEEIIINPHFQRYFVWDDLQKSRFIESILLNIPIPPIFVYQTEDSTWELVDGLQRLSTVFEFAGILRHPDGGHYEPSLLSGTQMLPALDSCCWESNGGSEPDIGSNNRLAIKRSRMRIEILKSNTDDRAKFELFQRLNTGGTKLEPQEVRNATLIMIDRSLFEWVKELSDWDVFLYCTDLSEKQINRQYNIELVLRFIVYRNHKYTSGLDVHEYINEGMIDIALSDDFEKSLEDNVFKDTFLFLHDSLGPNSFKEWTGDKFIRRFLISAFEAVAYGIATNIEDYRKLDSSDREGIIREKVENLWSQPTYESNSGAGVRGTTRLRNLLPFAEEYFRVDQ